MATPEARLAALNQRLAELEVTISKLEAAKQGYAVNTTVSSTPVAAPVATPAAAPATDAAAPKTAVKPAQPRAKAGSKPTAKKAASTDAPVYKIAEYNPGFVPEASVEPVTGYLNQVTLDEETIAKSFTPNEARQRTMAREHGLMTSIFYRASPDYYSWTLEQRRALLNAPTIHYLCKTVLMHNTKCPHTNFDDKKDSKYYLVIVQYSARIHNDRCGQAIRMLNNPPPSRNAFNFRLAPTEVNDELTGYTHNGVTPLGTTKKIPVLLSHKIAELEHGFFWLGGGEVDLKWRISVKEFIEFFDPIIANITYDDENTNPE